jgi:hypothetical protein
VSQNQDFLKHLIEKEISMKSVFSTLFILCLGTVLSAQEKPVLQFSENGTFRIVRFPLNIFSIGGRPSRRDWEATARRGVAARRRHFF